MHSHIKIVKPEVKKIAEYLCFKWVSDTVDIYLISNF